MTDDITVRLGLDASGYLSGMQAVASSQQNFRRLVSGVNSGFGAMNISLASFSRGFREDLLLSAGVSKEFVESLRPVVDAENLLKNASGEAGRALRAQAEITAKKDETTEAFVTRLKELGFTEAEIKSRVDETGRSLRAQTAATDATSSSAGRLKTSLSVLSTNSASYIRRAYGIMDRLDISTLAVAESTERARAAQAKHNETVAQFGVNSLEAIKSQKELEAATDAVEKAQRRQHVSQALVVADLVSMAGKLPRAVEALQNVGASARAAAAGMTTAKLAAGALVTTMAGAAAILAGFAIFQAYQDGAKRGATATEELAAAQSNLVDTARRIGTPGEDFFNKIPLLNKAVTTTTEDYEKALRRLREAEAVLAAERTAENIRAQANALVEAEKASAALEATNQRLVTGMTSGFASLGINLSAFSQSFQADMLRNVGVSEDFIKSLKPAVDVEALLKNASGETGKALRAQAEITANKDETTEAFTARLRELGFTEEDLRARVDATGRALLSQAEATRLASDATAQATGSRGSSGDLLAALVGANQDSIIEQMTGAKKGSRGFADASQWFDAERILRVISGNTSDIGTPGGVGSFTGDVGSKERDRIVEIIKQIVLGQAGSSLWDDMLRRLNVNHVAAPTGGRSSAGGFVMNGGLHIHANTEAGGRAAARGAMDELASSSRRLGSFSS